MPGAVITEAGEPLGPNEIATATGMKAGNIRFLLLKLVKDGLVEKSEYGKYKIRSVSDVSSDSDVSDFEKC